MFGWCTRRGESVYIAFNSTQGRLQWSNCCKVEGYVCWRADGLNDDLVACF